MRRRGWLRSIGGTGLALLGEIVRQRSAVAAERTASENAVRQRSPGFGRAKSVLVVVASGGQSQLETWDPRPEAPSQVRGAFGAIQTAVPGTILCEHLPRLARLADRYAIVKSMSHEDLDHGSALYLALTGYYHSRLSSNPPPRETDHPFYGCVLEQQRPAVKFLRSSVLINGPALVPWEPGPGQYAGWLGRQYDSLIIGDVTTDQPVVRGLEQLDNVNGKTFRCMSPSHMRSVVCIRVTDPLARQNGTPSSGNNSGSSGLGGVRKFFSFANKAPHLGLRSGRSTATASSVSAK